MAQKKARNRRPGQQIEIVVDGMRVVASLWMYRGTWVAETTMKGGRYFQQIGRSDLEVVQRLKSAIKQHLATQNRGQPTGQPAPRMVGQMSGQASSQAGGRPVRRGDQPIGVRTVPSARPGHGQPPGEAQRSAPNQWPGHDQRPGPGPRPVTSEELPPDPDQAPASISSSVPGPPRAPGSPLTAGPDQAPPGGHEPNQPGATGEPRVSD